MTAASNVSPIIPEHAPEPQDHKPKKKRAAAREAAREAEAGDGFVTIEQCGVTLRIPVGGKIPYAAIRRFREGDNLGGTEVLLGEEQCKALEDAGATMDDFDAIGAKLLESVGN